MKCSRGKARKNGGAKGCGKAAEWKSQKTTFPLRLEIPQTPAGFPLSHSLGDCGTLTTNRTFHLLRKGDTSNVVSRGTFLMSVDKFPNSLDGIEKTGEPACGAFPPEPFSRTTSQGRLLECSGSRCSVP